ncbi:MAG: hypothetical protein A2Y62_19275 [Candidatus Fischerbacteria bacterium RBG_13_37_8]|uniref:HMA domain-containing protein n=1 Tax=Candidatus Fischerbacteria bacterium RBG_13_37_8 TaxID=1817863 RepID=A0A1F5VXH4_9BACT|nr:MAG: hypothetical protein A2Y62_19275 [Candidatus Fischerbacteria bacterium RBG_13_37_8]
MRRFVTMLMIVGLVIAFQGYAMSQKGPKVKRCLLKVEGMTCDNCVNKVKTALESIKGVKEATVSLDKKEAVVKFENGIDLQALVDAVKEKGYKAELKGEVIILNISGMHCNHCANEVKEVLERQKGIISADVSYEKKEAVVTCQPGKVTLEQLVDIIQSSTEYKASSKN